MSYNIGNSNGTLTPIAGNNKPDSYDPTIAGEEFSPAEAAHAIGDFFYYNRELYKAKTAIAIGDTLVNNTNIEKAAIGDELENKVNKSDSQYVQITLSASNWSNGEYSLENLYPSASYDIENVTTCESSTTAMRTAWNKADCGGFVSTNKIISHGTVPTIDIIVSMKIIKK